MPKIVLIIQTASTRNSREVGSHVFREVDWLSVPRQDEEVVIINEPDNGAARDGWDKMAVKRVEWQRDGTAHVYFAKIINLDTEDGLIMRHGWRPGATRRM